ncbi:MAG: EF-P lysine aminoacylase GenX [Beijerinckiaceae bacterium]|nr:EF-P lysine aminoacylase GenX [Beijerinckiaceae bacterium]
MPATPFWLHETHTRRRPALQVRARLKAAIRAHFEGEDFWEVETGLVQVSPGNETHLHAFEAHWIDMAGERASGYLHTSPEFAMKKLLAAGEERIFQFAPVFRAREASRLHAPEFSMLEWYRAKGAGKVASGFPSTPSAKQTKPEDYTALMADCAALLHLASEIGGRQEARFRGRTCDLTAEPERLSLVEAFQHHAGIALEACLTDREAFAAEATRIGVRIAADDTWGDIFSRILSERIEPHLGQGCATILDRYPISEAALARPCPDDPRFAERFELYVCGVELANAFGELTDPNEQRRRFEADMAEKQRLYGESYPLDEDFLAALAHMPPASGAALGFDRLAMLAAGVESVHEVIATPFPFGEGA